MLGAMAGARVLRSDAGIPSGPVAVRVFIVVRILSTRLLFKLQRFKLERVLCVAGWRQGQLLSTFQVTTSANALFRIFKSMVTRSPFAELNVAALMNSHALPDSSEANIEDPYSLDALLNPSF